MTGSAVPGAAVPGAIVPGSPGTSAQPAAAPPPAAPLVPPGFASPMAWQRQARPSEAPPEVPSQDTGTGADTATVTVSDTDAGTGIDSGGTAGRSFPLIPPGFASPMAFQHQAWPTGAPLEAQSADTGSGADSGTVTADVGDTDTGTGADAATVTIGTPPTPPPSAVLIPPGLASPMAFQRQAGPSGAPLLVPGQDTGAGTDTTSVQVSDSDTGAGAEGTPTITVSSADTGTGVDSSVEGPPVQSFPLTPPGLASPMSWRTHAWPSGAPTEVPSQDTGTGTDSSSITASVSDSDTGSGADSGSVTATISGTDTGTGADTGGIPGTAFPLTPPGFSSPMSWRTQRWPTGAPLGVPGQDTGTGTDTATAFVSITDSDTGSGVDAGAPAAGVTDTDTGTGTDTGSFAPPPVTGAGITWWLNPVRESMTGLDVSLYLSQLLGAIVQFSNTGTERLYVLASAPGVTLTVGVSSLVLDEPAESFPAVELAAGQLYAFGPFHTVLQVPGTSTIQVTLSTAYGVQAVVIQGPNSH